LWLQVVELLNAGLMAAYHTYKDVALAALPAALNSDARSLVNAAIAAHIAAAKVDAKHLQALKTPYPKA
jgi:hypothetical protein